MQVKLNRFSRIFYKHDAWIFGSLANHKEAILALMFISFFTFFQLGQVLLNVDGDLWLSRSSNFIKEIKDFNFEKTFQNPKPGVPLMWLAGSSIEVFLNLYNLKYGFRPQLFTHDTFYLVNFSAEFPLAFCHIIFLVLFYIFVSRVFDRRIGLFSLLLLGLNPYYLGIARFIHVDALASDFMCLSVLLLLLPFSTTRRYIFSGIFAGLAVLTKTSSLFLIPFFMLVWMTGLFLRTELGVSLWNKAGTPTLSGGLRFVNTLIIVGKIFAAWFLPLVIVYFLVFPAMWVKPMETLKTILSEALYVAQTGRTGIHNWWYYFGSLYRIQRSLFMIPLAVSVIFVIFQIKKYTTQHLRAFVVVTCFVIFYFLQMTLIKQKVDRYLMPILPFTAVLTSFLFGALYTHKKIFFYLVLGALSVNATYYTPHYVSFSIKNYQENTYAEMYKEVGDYFNSKPNPKNLKVVGMTKINSLKPFVAGQVRGHEEKPLEKWEHHYLVTNDFWLSKYGPPAYFNNCSKEHTVVFREVPYWDIYSCTNR